MDIKELNETYLGKTYYAVSDFSTIVPLRVEAINVRNAIAFSTVLNVDELEAHFKEGDKSESDWSTEEMLHEEYYQTLYCNKSPDEHFAVYSDRQKAIEVAKSQLDSSMESLERKMESLLRKKQYLESLK